MTRRGLALGALVATAVAVAPTPAGAAEVKTFVAQTQAAFLTGTLEGISVDPLGRLRLADRVERLTAIDEPFLLAAAAHPDGWVVGTGNAGRVLLVDRKGTVRQLFAAPEPEVFAVLADPDGTVYAASSPNGKVYRIPPAGKGEPGVFFDPGETYVWALARDASGALLVATGTQGRLYRVDAGGAGTLAYDGDDTHLRSLLALPDGGAVVGTAGEGLVIRLTPDAPGSSGKSPGTFRARTLYDAAEPEVVALAAGPEGTVYAALVASEASRVDLAGAGAGGRGGGGGPKGGGGDQGGGAQGSDDEGDEGGEGTVTVTVSAGGEVPVATGSRPPGFSGPRSELIQIAPTGLVESVWKFDGETVYDLLWLRDRLWVATGLEGKLFSFDGTQMVLEQDVDDAQVVALAADRSGPAFATTNAAAVYRVGGGTERQGTYTSPALDAGQIARFGVLRWRGELPAGAGVDFSLRTGLSAEPDLTWSEWTAWRPGAVEGRGGNGARLGGEVAVGDLDRARYVQWRARLSAGDGAGDGASPRLFAVELSYRQENLRPRIDRFAAMDPGAILVPANFNPTNQAFEPVSPDKQGFFTTLEPAAEDSRMKTLWKKGYRTLRWRASDDNGDHLVYGLDFLPAPDAEAGPDGAWLAMAADLDDDFYSFDSTALPDGVYRFRLTASDRDGNDDGEALAAERLSEPVVIDQSPPERLGVERRGKTLAVTVEDAWSPLRRAEVSTDAGEWKDAVAADGLVDGRREVFEVTPPAGARLVLLRVMDAAFNVVTFDLSGEVR